MARTLDWNRSDTLYTAAALVWAVLLFALPPADRIFLRGDMVYYAGLEHAVREALASGQSPLWNRFLSEPLLANPQSMAFYPPSMVLRAVFDIPAYLKAHAILHAWAAALGLYLLLRHRGFSRAASAAGAATVAFSPFYVMRVVIGHVTLLPVIAASAFVTLFHQRYLASGRFRDIAGTLAAAVLLVLSGHTQYTFTGCLLPFAALVAHLAGLRGIAAWRTAAVRTLIPGVFAGGLLAFQLAPMLEYFPLTIRAAGFSAEQSAAYGLTPVLLLNLFAAFPAIEAGWAVMTAQETLGVTTVMIAGFVALALRSTGSARRTVVFALVLGGAGILLALGAHTPVYPALYNALPFMRAPGRFLLLWGFAAAVLVAAGADVLRSDLRAGRPPRALWAGGCIAAAALAWLGVRMLLIERWGRGPHLHGFALTAGVLATWLTLLLLRRRMAPATWFRAALALAGLDASAHSLYGAWWPAFDRIYPARAATVPPVECLRGHIDITAVRLTGMGQAGADYKGNTYDDICAAARAGIPVLMDYSANLTLPHDLFALGARGYRILGASYCAPLVPAETPAGWTATDPGCGVPLLEAPGRLPRAAFAAAIRRVDDDPAASRVAVSDPAFDPALETVVSLDPARPLPVVDGSDGFAAGITAYTANEIEVSITAPRPGLLVLAEVYYPGWKAWVDDAPADVLRVNHTLRGVAVPAGARRVRFVYEPASVRNGVRVTAITALVLLVFGVAARRRASAPETDP